MMQLLCDGVALDLYADASLQFTHDNPLFAFDNLKCERTTEFKLPCTPKNDKVFSCAKIPAYSGEGMRRRFTTQLIDGVVQKNGYLYLSSFDGKDYKAIFVTGEFVGLQAIKNLGKIKDLVTFNDYVMASTYGSAPSSNVGVLWANVSYRKEGGTILHPSIELKGLYNAICTAQSITSQAMPAAAENVRIVAGKLSGTKDASVQFIGSGGSMAEDTESFPVCYSVSFNKLNELVRTTTAKIMRRIGDRTPYLYYSGSAQQFIARQDIEIEFPSDWDDDLFIGYFIDGGSWYLSEFHFLGNRSFSATYGSSTTQYTITGESLRGRKVKIEAGDKFVIISKYDFLHEGSSSGTEQGWALGSNSCSFKISSEAEQSGAIIHLQDNLPDMTFVELLKTIAALSGCVLNYNNADGIMFETLNTSNYAVKNVHDLTKKGEVLRTFSDYAQHNLIIFDDDNNNTGVDYTIDNDNIKEEKELQKLPFAKGESYAGSLYIRTDEDKGVLGTNNGGPYLVQVSLPKCAGLQSLCDASTQIKASARMTLLEYEQIAPKTLVQIDGTRYVWTNRSWQKKEAQFTLARIS